MKQNMIVRLWILLAVFGIQTSLLANLVCKNGNPMTPGQLSPTTDCMATIDSSLILDDVQNVCVGPFQFTVRTYPGQIVIGSAMNIVTVDLSAHLNTVIEVVIKQIASGNECSSYFLVEDKQPPSLTCPKDTIVPCTASLDTLFLGAATATDNCDGQVIITWEDVIDGPNCTDFNPDTIAKITRTWYGEDDHGMTGSCEQEIIMLKSKMADVVFPVNTSVLCTNQNFNPNNTGWPTISGMPLKPGGLCNFDVTYIDQDLPGLGGHILKKRTWSVQDTCTGADSIHMQIISVNDITVPQVTCPPMQTFNTTPGLCTGAAILPQPTVMDCSTYSVSVEIPGKGAGFSIPGLEPGMYNAIYTVTDAFGLFTSCSTVVKIVDNETPVAICEDTLVVSLNSQGIGTVHDYDLDAGSYDNCGPVDLSVSLNGVDFFESVNLGCSNVGTFVKVTLRARAVLNLNSFTTCNTHIRVQDKIAPIFLSCPGNLTVDCEANFSNLDLFGKPAVYESCGHTLTKDSTINITNCGTGTIIRRWTATDPSGNTSTCTQTITVVNQTPFNGTGFDWPEDYTVTNNCVLPQDLEPNDLPAAYGFPVMPNAPCAMFAVSHNDQVFNIGYPACYKIVRTWKVLDWCQYNAATGAGIWTKQQIIAVMDTQKPTVTFCPPNDTFGLDNTCTMGAVILDAVQAVGNCAGEGITITNDSPFATAHGANASGNYPKGVHTIKFTITDACGNKTTCSSVVTVMDLKDPTPYCKFGLVAELQAMPGIPPVMAVVQASQLNFASYDNCSSPGNLKFTMRRFGDLNPPTATQLVFECAHEGENQVELWVTDEAGNSDYCITPVFIQDNMDLCNDDILVVNAMISGEVVTETGTSLTGVNVQIANPTMTETTNTTGVYEFHDLPTGSSYEVAPYRNDAPLNGVTTFDLVLMSRHILGMAPLNSPYKIIAADINKSGSVTTADMLELRKVILQIVPTFPNNTSWRFVKRDYVFPNPANPFSPAFPEAKMVQPLSQDVYDADFVGVKIGDLNCSASTSFGSETGDRNNGETLTLFTEDRTVQAGELIEIPIQVKDKRALIALQLAFEFETDDLELQGIEKGDLPGFSGKCFGLSHAAAGIVTAGWFDTHTARLEENDALFSLRFKVKSPSRLSEMLALSPVFDALAYDEKETTMNIELEFLNQTAANALAAFELHQNYPNPFKKATRIAFTLPEAGDAKLTVFDLSGRVLKTVEQSFNIGYNEVSIERQELPSGGVLFYQLETPTQTARRKMILLQ
jgi:hypothetical protein